MSANAPAPLRITRRRVADNEEEIVARDGQGYGVGVLELMWGRKWCQVRWVSVSGQHRRRGVATLLYTEAARIACDELDLPLVSDFDLTEESRGFWEKQVRAGRAQWNEEHGVFILDCKTVDDRGLRGLGAAPGDRDALMQELTDWMVVELKRMFERADIVIDDKRVLAEVPGRDKGRHRWTWEIGLRARMMGQRRLPPHNDDRVFFLPVVETMVPPPKTGKGSRAGSSRAITPAQPFDLAYAYYSMIFDRACTRRDPFVEATGRYVDAHDVGIWSRSVLSDENQSREVRLALDVWRLGVRLANEIERVWKSEFPAHAKRLPEYWYRGEDVLTAEGGILQRSYFNRLNAWDPMEILSTVNVRVHHALNWPIVHYLVTRESPLWTPPGPYEEYVADMRNGRPVRRHWGGDR